MLEEAIPKQKKRSPVRRALTLLLKLGVTILCFWYISRKIDFSQTWSALVRANWWLLLLALLFFLLSKVLSAFRLNIYFLNIGLRLRQVTNLKLYWLGLFYNLFLPGAISGDAYKVILLNRRRGAPYKKTSAAVLLDRFSGVLALGIILSVYGVLVLPDPYFDVLLIGGSLLGIAGFYFGIRYLFPDFLPSFLPTLIWALGVQGAQVVCIYLIQSAIGIPAGQHEWIFIFLVSAVVSILPLSLGGGLGTREFVFVEGARYFHLDPQTGIVISLLFYFLTVAGSVGGLYYQFRDPLSD